MFDLTIDEIAEIKSLVEKQKKATLKWVSTITELSEESIIDNASKMGLIIDGDTIRIPLESKEQSVRIIYDDTENIIYNQIMSEIQPSDAGSYSFSIDDTDKFLDISFNPGITDVIRFCRFDILLILYSIATIAEVILLALGFTWIFAYLAIGTACIVFTIIIIGMCIVLSYQLTISKGKIIIRKFLLKEKFDSKFTEKIVISTHKKSKKIFRKKDAQQYDILIFNTIAEEYKFNLRFFDIDESIVIRNTIIDFFKDELPIIIQDAEIG